MSKWGPGPLDLAVWSGFPPQADFCPGGKPSGHSGHIPLPFDPLGDSPAAHGCVTVSAMRTEAGCSEFQCTGVLTSTALWTLTMRLGPGGAGGAVELCWGSSSLLLSPP